MTEVTKAVEAVEVAEEVAGVAAKSSHPVLKAVGIGALVVLAVGGTVFGIKHHNKKKAEKAAIVDADSADIQDAEDADQE